MGISGLLPVIKPICQQKNVRELAQTRVGVDVYGWLHRGAFSCAMKLCRGVDTTAYVAYCMHRVRMLIHFNARPVLVFDGADLPMKADTHDERRDRRNEALSKAEHAYAQGDMKTAEEWYQRSYTVTSDMARKVIRECRKINVEYVVAPYEADAQLAWMMKTGYIDSVITEDSDLLVYGASKVFYKMNRYGDGDLYESKNLLSLDSLCMNNFTDDMFMYMCVCAGCDFFKGVPGLGIKKSHTVVKRFRTMIRLLLAIRQDRKYKVSKSFTADFARACLVFRHQTVYDMKTSMHMHLSELDDVAKAKLPSGVLSLSEDGTIDLSFLGSHREPSIAKRIAEGVIHPRSLQEYSEPLDVISRPLTTRRHSPLRLLRRKRQGQDGTSTGTQDIRGFQIQPASGTTSNPFSSSLNLRQRLTSRLSGAKAFNPRRVGSAFKAKQSSASLRSGIWASFKKSSAIHLSAQSKSGSDEEQREEASEKAKDVVMVEEASEDEVNNSEMKGEPSDPQPHEVSSIIDSLRSPTRPKISSSLRVEAVNRALGRFAATCKEDKRKKFIPPSKPPPSPDKHSYDLFERIDAELSRDDEGGAKDASSEEDCSQPKVGPKATSTQVRLSRFFPARNQDNGASTSSPASPSLSKSRKSPKLETGPRGPLREIQKRRLGRTGRSSVAKSFERFRRGAAGKKAVTTRKKS